MIIRPFVKIIARLGFVLCGVYINSLAQPILAIQHWETSQGAPVYFVNTPELPMIDVQIIFTAGSAYDDGQWGIASLVAGTLDEGTKTHDANQIADSFDQVGAQYNNSTTRDVTIISLRSLSDPKYLTPALQMFNEVLSQATFPETAVARVKQQILSKLHEQQQNPTDVAANAFFENLYPNHPYGHPSLGAVQTVSAITATQAQTFYQRYYVSHNAKIVIVGNLDRLTAQKIAEQFMTSLPKGSPAAPLAMENKQPNDGLHALAYPFQQNTIVTGQLGIDRQSSQYFPLMVGNYLLGEMPLGSLLFQQVRNQRGLAYGINSSFVLMTYRGPFVIFLQTRTAEKNQALDVTQKVLSQFISQGPTSQQLQLAKENIVEHFPLDLATNEQIIDVLAQMAINQRPLDYLDTYRDKVNAVTVEQVKQAFQTLINPQKMLTVTVGQ